MWLRMWGCASEGINLWASSITQIALREDPNHDMCTVAVQGLQGSAGGQLSSKD